MCCIVGHSQKRCSIVSIWLTQKSHRFDESIPTLTNITSVLSMHLGIEPGTWCTRKGDKTTPKALYNGKYTLRNTENVSALHVS